MKNYLMKHQNMHNSLMDIFIYLKCYLKLQHNIVISHEYFWKVYKSTTRSILNIIHA